MNVLAAAESGYAAKIGNFYFVDKLHLGKTCNVLDSYGIRIQEPAFECRIAAYEVKIMYGKLLKALKATEDKARIYQLNENNIIHTIGSYEGPCNKTYEVV